VASRRLVFWEAAWLHRVIFEFSGIRILFGVGSRGSSLQPLNLLFFESSQPNHFELAACMFAHPKRSFGAAGVIGNFPASTPAWVKSTNPKLLMSSPIY